MRIPFALRTRSARSTCSARPLAQTKEAHHFYPLLFYFRFREPFYSVSRLCFVLLDLTTLIDTALDREKHKSLVRAAPVGALRQGALMLLETLDRNFPTVQEIPSAAAEGRTSAQSYAAAVETLRRAGIETRPDTGSYADQRGRWDPLIRRVAPTLGYRMDEIDRRTQHSEASVA